MKLNLGVDQMNKLSYNYNRQVVGCEKQVIVVSNSKDAEERKKEILDVAEELFIKNGYDGTSTTDILARVGIARGTLYYHFKSKEEILDALIDRIIQSMVGNIHQALLGKETAVEKILCFLAATKVDSAIEKEITDYAHKPQNALMHQKIQDATLKVLIPILTRIIEEGIEEGSVYTEYPEEVAEMIMIYGTVVFDDMNEITNEEKERKIVAFVHNIEKLLNVEKGTLSALLQYIN